MNVHKNARLTPQGQLLLVLRIEEEGWTVADAAAAAGLSVRRTCHWLGRYRAGGERMLCDRIPRFGAGRAGSRDRATAARPHDRPADRPGACDAALDGGGGAAPARPRPSEGARPAGADGALPARAAGRPVALRHQEARPHRRPSGKASSTTKVKRSKNRSGEASAPTTRCHASINSLAASITNRVTEGKSAETPGAVRAPLLLSDIIICCRAYRVIHPATPDIDDCHTP